MLYLQSCSERTEMLGNLIFTTPEYINYQDEHNELYGMLRGILPEEHGRALLRLDDTSSEMEALVMDMAYEQGYKDGINFILSIMSENAGAPPAASPMR
jgi:hypothetical protein